VSNTCIESGVVKRRTTVLREDEYEGIKYEIQMRAWCGEDKNEGVKDSGCITFHRRVSRTAHVLNLLCKE
jgi:hypothetical protein